MRIFIVAAIVLIVFAIIANSAASGTCLAVDYFTWVAAALLAFFTDCLLGGYVWAIGPWTRSEA